MMIPPGRLLVKNHKPSIISINARFVQISQSRYNAVVLYGLSIIQEDVLVSVYDFSSI